MSKKEQLKLVKDLRALPESDDQREALAQAEEVYVSTFGPLPKEEENEADPYKPVPSLILFVICSVIFTIWFGLIFKGL